MSSYKCKFLRCNEQLDWVEHIRSCTVEISKGVGRFSLIVRESETGSLIADFLRASIRNVESLSSVVLRIYSQSGTRVALRFEEPTSLMAVFKILRENEIICSDTTAPSNTENNGVNNIMPDLSDPIVQEFVLKLLFREDFKSFVEDLGDLLTGYNEEML
jgi:hypothetical protein